MICPATQKAWQQWIEVTQSRCHLHFALEGGCLEQHVSIGREVGRRTAARIRDDVFTSPTTILEVGSSVGFNCYGLAELFPSSRVVGIEPDGEACAVAEATALDLCLENTDFIQGVGERLPFPDETFDLIVCHTVIEHVNDVDACIAEMARVLRPGGRIHLDAPNYLWPWEPHLRIVVPPLCPKPLMRLLARLQGAGANCGYAQHLKLVHPAWIERCFTRGGLRWTNRTELKLRLAAAGEDRQVVAYRRTAKILSIFRALGLADLLAGGLIRARCYPSLLYTAWK